MIAEMAVGFLTSNLTWHCVIYDRCLCFGAFLIALGVVIRASQRLGFDRRGQLR